MQAQRIGLAAPLLVLAILAHPPLSLADEPKRTIRIALTDTLFRDDPVDQADKTTRTFRTLFQEQTGLDGEVVRGIKADDLARQLKDGKIQLAIFQGFELAWARQKDADLKPLMIAVNHQPQLRALILVRDDSKAEKLADLKGKTLAIPRRTREACRLFLDRRCAAAGTTAKDFFGKVTAPANMETGVDTLVNGHVDAALIDSTFFDWYKDRKPARFARLKTIEKSALFPAVAIVYRKGGLDEASLRRLREGMIAAKDNPRGMELMTLCQVTRFDPVPEDYDRQLTEIAKAYPAPEPGKGKK